MRKIILKLIKIYQKTLSLDHGPLSFLYSEGFCRFRPTCSEYAYQAIEKYGTIKGSLIGFWRINRCNPFNKGGFDPVPEKDQTEPLIIKGLSILLTYILVIFSTLIIIKLYLER